MTMVDLLNIVFQITNIFCYYSKKKKLFSVICHFINGIMEIQVASSNSYKEFMP